MKNLSRQSFRGFNLGPFWDGRSARARWAALFLGTFTLFRASVAMGQAIDEAEALKHTVVGLPLEKLGPRVEEVDSSAIKYGRAAMYDPALAAALREKFKTPERKEAEAAARAAILDPVGFRELKEREARPRAEEAASEPEKERREEALRAILQPTEANRKKEQNRDAVGKRRKAIAEESIRRPHDFNKMVERHKSASVRAKEAEIIDAFTRPDVFLKELEQLKKTGSKKAPKNSTVPEQERPKTGGQPPGPEKGQQGGGR